MRKTILLLLTLAAVATSGCTSVKYTTTEKDGRQTSFSALAVGANKVVKDMSVGGSTEKTVRGLKFGLDSTDVSTPMDSLANILKLVAEGAAKGAAKTIVPVP